MYKEYDMLAGICCAGSTEIVTDAPSGGVFLCEHGNENDLEM